MSVAVVDFGGQYAHLLAQQIRKLGVHSVIVNPQLSTDQAKQFKGLILSGGPHSVYSDELIHNKEIFNIGIPILGICYGHQLLCKHFGATVISGHSIEYGPAKLLNTRGVLFNALEIPQVWMSHSDTVIDLPPCLQITANTDDCAIAAIEHTQLPIYGVQFHPEVKHTLCGRELLMNFLKLCDCSFDWDIQDYLQTLIENLRNKYINNSVFMLLSGGVDSTVAFTVLNQALGANRVLGLHIDNGFMRYNESRQVAEAFQKLAISVVDASEDFYTALDGITDPQQKRIIIGNLFLDIQQREIEKLGLGSEWLLGQGTIYPDTIESGGTQNSKIIKTHHNRVDRIQELISQGRVVEPLVDLYKDEVRELGELLGLPHDLVWRHPFPGPGLAIRTLCNIGTCSTDLAPLQAAVNLLISDYPVNAIILPIKSVGIQGDTRSFAHPVLLVNSAEASIDWYTLEKVSTLITNQFNQVNRVLFQLASKAEWRKPCLITATLTKSRLRELQRIDHIVTEFLKHNQLYEKVWQCPVVLIPCAPVENSESIVLRPVESTEAMTANFSKLPQELLTNLANNLLDSTIASILYDITNKPPGTIEWE